MRTQCLRIVNVTGENTSSNKTDCFLTLSAARNKQNTLAEMLLISAQLRNYSVRSLQIPSSTLTGSKPQATSKKAKLAVMHNNLSEACIHTSETSPSFKPTPFGASSQQSGNVVSVTSHAQSLYSAQQFQMPSSLSLVPKVTMALLFAFRSLNASLCSLLNHTM